MCGVSRRDRTKFLERLGKSTLNTLPLSLIFILCLCRLLQEFDPDVNSVSSFLMAPILFLFTSRPDWISAIGLSCACLRACVWGHRFPLLAISFVGWWGPGPYPRDFPCWQPTDLPSWFSEIHFTFSAKLVGPHSSRDANIWYGKVWQVLDQNLKYYLWTCLLIE